MTRARMRQLNLEVSSFLSDPFYTFENRLLPNGVFLLRNIGEGYGGHRGRGGDKDDQQGRPTGTGGPVQHDFESASASRTTLPSTGHPGCIWTPFSTIHIWMEILFDKEANPSGLTSKALWNQQESSKQVSVQNLSGCCDTVFWSVGPFIVLEPIRGRVQGG